MKKIVFITGASSGIGKACAEIFARQGYDIIISARRKERLTELKEFLEKNYKTFVCSLQFDVQQKENLSHRCEGKVSVASSCTKFPH